MCEYVYSLEISIYKILLVANRDHFTSVFPIWMHFISFSFWLDPPKQHWLEVVRAGIFFFVPMLGEGIQLFTINCDVNCGYSIDDLYWIGCVPSTSRFLRVFFLFLFYLFWLETSEKFCERHSMLSSKRKLNFWFIKKNMHVNLQCFAVWMSHIPMVMLTSQLLCQIVFLIQNVTTC